jgi:hypothetical protein
VDFALPTQATNPGCSMSEGSTTGSITEQVGLGASRW